MPIKLTDSSEEMGEAGVLKGLLWCPRKQNPYSYFYLVPHFFCPQAFFIIFIAITRTAPWIAWSFSWDKLCWQQESQLKSWYLLTGLAPGCILAHRSSANCFLECCLPTWQSLVCIVYLNTTLKPSARTIGQAHNDLLHFGLLPLLLSQRNAF